MMLRYEIKHYSVLSKDDLFVLPLRHFVINLTC